MAYSWNYVDVVTDQNGEARSPKRACNEFRSVLVERNSFTPPTKERLLTFNSLKSRVLTLQPTFARFDHLSPVLKFEFYISIYLYVLYKSIYLSIYIYICNHMNHIKSTFNSFGSPNQRNPVGGGETCAEIGIKIFFSKAMLSWKFWDI